MRKCRWTGSVRRLWPPMSDCVSRTKAQGSQFTSFALTRRLREAGIRISMDGRGRWMDNIFIERLWRSLKYEAVYLHEIADGFTARRVIGEWIGFYNTQRPHSALGGRTPAEVCRGDTPVDMMDKPLRALPTPPQAQQQQQQDRFKGILAACTSTGIHFKTAARLYEKAKPPHDSTCQWAGQGARTATWHREILFKGLAATTAMGFRRGRRN